MKLPAQKALPSEKEFSAPSGQEDLDFDLDITLAVDDKTRHYLYFGVHRSAEEKERSGHATDFGGATVTRKARMHNGRGNADLTLDESSFELVKCPTQLSTEDFYNLDADGGKKLEKYKSEVEKVVKAKIGCDEVVFVPGFHQVRNAAKQTGLQATKVAGYAGGGPHTDSSPLSGDEQACLLLSQLEARDGADPDKKTRYKRYLYLNAWRNISEDPIENDHLAMMDERTAVKPDDYVTKDLFGPGYSVVQYALSARHADQHKWYYFPAMEKDECILFKQTDSDWTKPGRTCFHMSAHDARVQTHRPRESIELRMFCFWKEAAVDSMPTAENFNLAPAENPEGAAPYSGSPADYVEKFAALTTMRGWPEMGRAWVRRTLQTHGANRDAGIAAITEVLVDDALGYQGTKHFAPKEKAAIVAVLLADEGVYMAAARKHFLALVADNAPRARWWKFW